MADQSVTPEQMKAFDFPALLADNDIDKLEQVAQSWGEQRRIGLCILSKSKAQLVQAMSGDESVALGFMDVMDKSKEYRAHLQGLIEQAECVEARILVAASSLEEEQQ